MAQRFAVQYLVFCTSVEHPDVRRPQRNSTLSGVDYVFEVPPGTEFPFEPDEFWLYARIYWLRDRPGSTPPLTISCVWLDAPGGKEVEIWQRPVGVVQFTRPGDVRSRAWVFRNTPGDAQYPFPGLGRYVFRLWHPTRWSGERTRSREYIRIGVST
ncbi:hypothetical protein [Gemmata sp.]|uniref:hypothetical protein n=1 Tax=Gemmata sp. TaxID=1914242 RepID=UPI003F70E20A